jgi:polysaccharide export outer membrane protein
MRANRTGSPHLRQRTFALIAIALLGVAALLAKTPRLVAFSTPPPPVTIPGDVISVTLAMNTGRVSGNYEIGRDGQLAMPRMGAFHAAGLTVPELQSLITRRLGSVDVQLLGGAGKKYVLNGAVLKPGPYPLLKATTILDALNASGGFNAAAITNNIVLLRDQRVPAIHDAVTFSESIPFNYDEVIRGIHTEQNVILRDGDVLLVPGYRHRREQ